MFKAELHTQCISQVGVTRNGNTLKPTTPYNVSHYIHRVLPSGPTGALLPGPEDGGIRGREEGHQSVVGAPTETGTVEWDYTRFIPHVAVVNLGTNDYDLSQIVHEQPSLAHFQGNYTKFLLDMVARYSSSSPAASSSHLPALIVACGPMTSVQCAAAERCAAEVAAAHPEMKVRFTNLTLPKDQLTGCIGHPNVKGHASLLDQLAPVIRNVTGWDA
jgi:hypothetical protein